MKYYKKSMKRGRPSKRNIIQSNIIEVLGSSSVPLTTSALRKIISEKLKQTISWNTIQKYINELTKLEKIQAIALPHSKKEGKKGLTVYILKK
jgi:hypothetical protein